MSTRTWRVGELATGSGVSVRTLHHYDELGLLSPSERTPAGHRLYTAGDVRRLHRILALRGFGLSLADVARVLGGEVDDAAGLVRDQLRQVEEQLRAGAVLRGRLTAVLRELDAAEHPSPSLLLEVMDAMSELHRRLTPEHFEAMIEARKRWAEDLSPEDRAAAVRARAEAAEALTDDDVAHLAAALDARMPS